MPNCVLLEQAKIVRAPTQLGSYSIGLGRVPRVLPEPPNFVRAPKPNFTSNIPSDFLFLNIENLGVIVNLVALF